jgi:hypothetical protein
MRIDVRHSSFIAWSTDFARLLNQFYSNSLILEANVANRKSLRRRTGAALLSQGSHC